MKREMSHERMQEVVGEALTDLGLSLAGMSSGQVQVDNQTFLVKDGVATLKPPRTEEEIRQAAASLGNQLNDIADGRLQINGSTYLIYGEKAIEDTVRLLLLDEQGAEFTYTIDGDRARQMITERSAVIQGELSPEPFYGYVSGMCR